MYQHINFQSLRTSPVDQQASLDQETLLEKTSLGEEPLLYLQSKNQRRLLLFTAGFWLLLFICLAETYALVVRNDKQPSSKDQALKEASVPDCMQYSIDIFKEKS